MSGLPSDGSDKRRIHHYGHDEASQEAVRAGARFRAPPAFVARMKSGVVPRATADPGFHPGDESAEGPSLGVPTNSRSG
jgi:hypothetical protein